MYLRHKSRDVVDDLGMHEAQIRSSSLNNTQACCIVPNTRWPGQFAMTLLHYSTAIVMKYYSRRPFLWCLNICICSKQALRRAQNDALADHYNSNFALLQQSTSFFSMSGHTNISSNLRIDLSLDMRTVRLLLSEVCHGGRIHSNGGFPFATRHDPR